MNGKILIVDDTKNIRKLLSTCLEVEGYEVITAEDGQQALNLIESEFFDIVFLDIKMPEMSGTEVLKRIRAMKKNMPIIIMTAYATVKNAVECTKLGAIEYLQKPFTADKVRSVLNEMLSNENKNHTYKEDYRQRGRELILEGKFDDAFEILKMALSTNPSDSDIYTLIGTIYEKKGDFDNSRKFYNAAKQFE
jgi:Response regulator containing CheY-like receiver, AAA-type ATPase, and DNA-binding domains